MKRFLFLAAIYVTLAMPLNARIIVVDQNGLIKSIQAAINLAADGDTIKVMPGTYTEQVLLNKDVLLMGSGYENTIITGSFSPTVEIQSGIMQWFQISSLSGNGVHMNGGILRNTVVRGCAGNAIYASKGKSNIINCVITQNAGSAVWVENNGTAVYITNTISWNNRGWYNYDYRGLNNSYLSVTYSIGKVDLRAYGNTQAVYNVDPKFASEDDFHIPAGSPGWDKGAPSLTDPDGSRSDMGYFGGPHAPVYPVVTGIQLIPLESGGVKIKVTGRANY